MLQHRSQPAAEIPASPTGEQERLVRVENMMRALQDALNMVYDADADRQLHKLAYDYCRLAGQPPCGQPLCDLSHLPADCPILDNPASSCSEEEGASRRPTRPRA